MAPAELEDLLRLHDKILDVAVIGVPHERHGEVPKAFVVAKEGLQAEDIHAFVAGKVAEFKQLQGGIEFVEQIPKSAAGKILRRELRQRTD